MQGVEDQERRKVEQAKAESREVLWLVDRDGKGKVIDGWAVEAVRESRRIDELGDMDDVQKSLKKAKYFLGWRPTEEYKQLRDERMTAWELELVRKVNVQLLRRRGELKGMVEGAVSFQEERLERLGMEPNARAMEMSHIIRVTDSVGTAFADGEASGLAWLAAALHDEKKYFDVGDRRAVGILGPHDLLGAVDAEEKVEKLLTKVMGFKEQEAKAAGKYVKLLISRHGRNEFPLIKGRQETPREAHILPDQAYMVWGYPVYDLTSEGLPMCAEGVSKKASAMMERDAVILNGADLLDGARRESFVKYHSGTPGDVLVGNMRRRSGEIDNKDLAALYGTVGIVDSFAMSYRGNLMGCDEMVRNYLVKKNMPELIRAGLLLRLTQDYPGMQEGSEEYEMYRNFLGAEVFDGAVARFKKMAELCREFLDGKMTVADFKGKHGQEFLGLVEGFAKVDLSDGREDEGRRVMVRSMAKSEDYRGVVGMFAFPGEQFGSW